MPGPEQPFAGQENEHPVFETEPVPAEPEEVGVEGPESGKVDLASFYAAELHRLHGFDGDPSVRIWRSLAERAEKSDRDSVYRQPARAEQSAARKLSAIDKIRRQYLSLQAWRFGAENFDQFNRLAAYLEDTVETFEVKRIKISGSPTEEQRKALLENWSRRGWVGDEFNYGDGKTLRLFRRFPVRLGKEEAKNLINLVSAENNPVELLQGLRKLGFEPTSWMLKSDKIMQELGRFLRAPYAAKALEMASAIHSWRADWFSGQQSHETNRPIEEGQIEFLAELAENPNLEEDFPIELLQKINVLAKAFHATLSVPEINDFRIIAENLYYLDFAEFLAGFSVRIYRGGAQPLARKIIALDEAGVLRPIVDLYRAGVSLEGPRDLPSIKDLVYSQEEFSSHSRNFQTTVESLRALLNSPHVQRVLAEKPRRDFLELVASITGSKLSYDRLGTAEQWAGEDFDHAQEFIFVLKLISSAGVESLDYYLKDYQTIGEMARSEGLMSAFTDREFPVFLEGLKSKLGYKPSFFDFYYQGNSVLVNAFSNPKIRQGLLSEDGAAIIKIFKPDGGFHISRAEYYAKLAEAPNVPRLLKALQNLNCDLGDYGPDEKFLTDLAASEETLAKLESEEVMAFVSKLVGAYGGRVKVERVESLLAIHNDPERRSRLFLPANAEYIKTMEGNASSPSELEKMAEMPLVKRELLARIVENFSYNPSFGYGFTGQDQMLTRLLGSQDLQARLFSLEVLGNYKHLSELFGYRLSAADIDSLVSISTEMIDFMAKLKHYGYSFRIEDINSLLPFLGDRERIYSVLEIVKKYGYRFQSHDSRYLLAIAGHANRLEQMLELLKDGINYKFQVAHSTDLVKLIDADFSHERLMAAQDIYNRYKGEYDARFSFKEIASSQLLLDYEETIKRLQGYGYQVSLTSLYRLEPLLISSNQEELFEVLDVWREELNLGFDPRLSEDLALLAAMPDAAGKVRRAAELFQGAPANELLTNKFRLFTALGAEAETCKRVLKMFGDDYFVQGRDARSRLERFWGMISTRQIPDALLAKIVSVSIKPRDLDDLFLLTSINLEIATSGQNDNWYGSILSAPDFRRAYAEFRKVMIALAIPDIYSDLIPQEISLKLSQMEDEAGRRPEFQDVLSISARSLGIYRSKYPTESGAFQALKSAIRQALELNLAETPDDYHGRRTELSAGQFGFIFESLPSGLREKATAAWLDLSKSRLTRLSGSIVTKEEDTLSRLGLVRDVIQTDVAAHLPELFLAKTGRMANDSEASIIFRQFLFSEDGSMKKDLVDIYESVARFINRAQANLRDPNFSKEEKTKLGKNMAIYRSLSEMAKALYRLGSINESKFKAKRDYLKEIDKYISTLSVGLKRMGLLDPDELDDDVNVRALQEEVLADFSKLKGVMTEENVAGQVTVEVKTTVAFVDLARAPEMTASCQRLTEVTGYNQSAYSRLLDGNDEMVDVYERVGADKRRLARTFIELTKIRENEDEAPRLAVLMDRIYVNSQYHALSDHFEAEMVAHVLDRLSEVPEAAIILPKNFILAGNIRQLLADKGYILRNVSGQYFINESNVKLTKYYDSLGGGRDVRTSSWFNFENLLLVEKQLA